MTLESETVRSFFVPLLKPGDDKEADDPRIVYMASIEKVNDYLERYLIRMGITESISEKNKHLVFPTLPSGR